MGTRLPSREVERFANLDGSETEVLTPRDERLLLQELIECKAKLARALGEIKGYDGPEAADDPHSLAQHIAGAYSGDRAEQARLGAVYRRYSEIRTKLALANMKLVAHVAKRFRARGIPYFDLLQEGFCGLLESIDRFDLTHQTKLATYATWWIRQAMQRVVASGAYPVRLTPRHLRRLAQDQEQREREGTGDAEDSVSTLPTEMIQCIHAATRPAVSLDSYYASESGFNLLQTMSDPEGDHTEDVDTDETVEKLMQVLRPREQLVLSLRFGLGGRERLSLSQVGKLLEVSKERVRQIEDRALQKLRASADKHNLGDHLALTL